MNDIDHLHRTRDALLPFYETDITLSEYSYGPGKWTLRQILLHLTDTEQVMLDRCKRIIADDRPLLWGFDENRWQERLYARRRDLSIAGAVFTACRAAIIELATLASDADLQRVAVHSERGCRTLQQVLAMVHGHTDHHLGQMHAIREGRPWQARPATYAGSEHTA